MRKVKMASPPPLEVDCHDESHDEKCGCEKLLDFDVQIEPYTGILFDDHVLTGSHVPFRNSRLSDSIEWGLKLGMYVIQVYMGSQQRFKRTRITSNDIEKTLSLLEKYPTHLFTHSPVTFNLAGSVTKKSLAWCGNEDVDKTMNSLLEELSYELSVLSKVGAKGTVIHPGCYIKEKGKSQEQIEEEAIAAIAKTLDFAVFTEGITTAKVLLENSAGEGGKVAYNLNQLVRIRERMINKKNQEHVAFCLDTCHAFAAGLYDLSCIEGVAKMFSHIDKVKREGKGCVELIHLNDSEVPFNAKRDLHALLRTGYVWGKDDTALKYLLAEAGQRRIPCVLETSPSDMYTLYELLGEKI
jgi:deoxyribonuclease IV